MKKNSKHNLRNKMRYMTMNAGSLEAALLAKLAPVTPPSQIVVTAPNPTINQTLKSAFEPNQTASQNQSVGVAKADYVNTKAAQNQAYLNHLKEKKKANEERRARAYKAKARAPKRV